LRLCGENGVYGLGENLINTDRTAKTPSNFLIALQNVFYWRADAHEGKTSLTGIGIGG